MDSLGFCIKEKALNVYAYVIMTNHVHLIVQSPPGKLPDTIRDLKKITSHSIINSIKNTPESRREWLLHRFEWNATQNKRSSNNQFWTHENHAISITSEQFFREKMAYIHRNPVRAGWVACEEDYVYSSAKSLYCNVEGSLRLAHW